MVQDPETHFVPRAKACLPGVVADLGEFQWGGPFETFFETRGNHMLCLRMSQSPFSMTGYMTRDKVSGACTDIGLLNFSPAGTGMYYHRSGGIPVRVVRFAFDADRFHGVADALSDLNPRALTACLDIRSQRLGETMVRLAQELDAPGFASEVLVESLALSAMVDVARYVRTSRESGAKDNARLEMWQIRRIDQYLRDFEGAAPTISDLAQQCGVSRAHLSRLFKSTTGLTVHGYVVEVRLQRAKAYLGGVRLGIESDCRALRLRPTRQLFSGIPEGRWDYTPPLPPAVPQTVS